MSNNPTRVISSLTGKVRDMPSEGAIELLFPNWQPGKESVTFVCAHDDDAVAGSTTLINHLRKDYNAQVNILVLTDGRNGFEPDKVLEAYSDLFRIVRRRIPKFDESLKACIETMQVDPEYKQKVSQVLRSEMAHLRHKETIAAYSTIGVSPSNIHYFKYDGNTIGDLEIGPYMTLRTPDGQPGVYQWIIQKFRETQTTRVLGINPGDAHLDHRAASDATVAMAARARRNLYWIDGRDAPIQKNTMQTDGLYYLIYEERPADAEFEEPALAVYGNESDAEIKRHVLGQYSSQKRLLAEYEKLLKLGNMEFYDYFPEISRPITKDSEYHNRFHLINAANS